MQEAMHPDYLYRLARSGSAQDRRMLGDAVTGMMHKEMTDQQRSLIQDILLQLLQEAEHDLKLHLAQALAHEPSCPIALLDYLVYQSDFVYAEPILRYSEVLSDEYLIEIVQKIDLKEYRRTIAQRMHIGSDLARYLMATNDMDVFKTILVNKGAKLCPVSMNWLVNVALHVSEMQKPVLQRPEMTADLAVKLYWYAAESLRGVIAEHFPIDQDRIDHLLTRVIEQRMVHHHRKTQQDTVIPQPMVDAALQLKKHKKITSRLVIDTAKKDEHTKLCCLWGALLLVDPNALMQQLNDDFVRTVAVLSVASRFTRQDYSDVFMALLRRKTGQSVTPKSIQEAMQAYDALNFEKAQYIVHNWQCETMKDVIV